MTTVWIPWSVQRIENALAAILSEEIDREILAQLGITSVDRAKGHNQAYLELCELEWLAQQNIAVESVEPNNNHRCFGLLFSDSDSAMLFVLTWQPKDEIWLIDESDLHASC